MDIAIGRVVEEVERTVVFASFGAVVADAAAGDAHREMCGCSPAHKHAHCMGHRYI